jgi:predicted transcriptional regulator
VVEAGKVVGIVGKKDVLRTLFKKTSDPGEREAAE